MHAYNLSLEAFVTKSEEPKRLQHRRAIVQKFQKNSWKFSFNTFSVFSSNSRKLQTKLLKKIMKFQKIPTFSGKKEESIMDA